MVNGLPQFCRILHFNRQDRAAEHEEDRLPAVQVEAHCAAECGKQVGLRIEPDHLRNLCDHRFHLIAGVGRTELRCVSGQSQNGVVKLRRVETARRKTCRIDWQWRKVFQSERALIGQGKQSFRFAFHLDVSLAPRGLTLVARLDHHRAEIVQAECLGNRVDRDWLGRRNRKRHRAVGVADRSDVEPRDNVAAESALLAEFLPHLARHQVRCTAIQNGNMIRGGIDPRGHNQMSSLFPPGDFNAGGVRDDDALDGAIADDSNVDVGTGRLQNEVGNRLSKFPRPFENDDGLRQSDWRSTRNRIGQRDGQRGAFLFDVLEEALGLFGDGSGASGLSGCQLFEHFLDHRHQTGFDECLVGRRLRVGLAGNVGAFHVDKQHRLLRDQRGNWSRVFFILSLPGREHDQSDNARRQHAAPGNSSQIGGHGSTPPVR